MLLGALTDPGPATRILDIGTGCGVLALMMAQKSKANIDAVEVDPASAKEAQENFQRSPWSARLACFGISLQLFQMTIRQRYDLIICNPPFFQNSLKPSDYKKSLARHGLILSMESLFQTVMTLLRKDGRFSFILPADQWPEARKLAERSFLYPEKLIRIYPYPGGRITRLIPELIPVLPLRIQESELTILNEERKFSPEYLEATKDYHYF